MGGSVPAIEVGYFQEAIAQSAYAEQRRAEAGEKVVVGVNRYITDEPAPRLAAPDYASLAAGQRRRLVDARARRDAKAVGQALEAIRAVAGDPNALLMPNILEAVRVRATVGEISDVLRDTWGVYHPV